MDSPQNISEVVNYETYLSPQYHLSLQPVLGAVEDL